MTRASQFSRVAVVAGVLAALAVAAVLAKVRVQTHYDKTFDFNRVTTWAWHADGAGEVKMAVTADDDPEAVRSRYEPVIVEAVEQEIASRGWRRVTEGEPDVRVIYYLLISTGASSQQMGQFVQAVPEWGLPPLSGPTTSFRVIHQGSLVLDVISPKPLDVVFRSIGQAEIHLERTPEERSRRLREAIHEMLKKFPPKK